MTPTVLTNGNPRLNLELATREPRPGRISTDIRRPKEKRQRRQRRTVVER